MVFKTPYIKRDSQGIIVGIITPTGADTSITAATEISVTVSNGAVSQVTDNSEHGATVTFVGSGDGKVQGNSATLVGDKTTVNFKGTDKTGTAQTTVSSDCLVFVDSSANAQTITIDDNPSGIGGGTITFGDKAQGKASTVDVTINTATSYSMYGMNNGAITILNNGNVVTY